MSEWVTLKAEDGHELQGYVARPAGAPKGALVVVQEIFGVNFHVRAMADWFAAVGYLVVAPAMFDRVERGFEVGYGPDDFEKAKSFLPKLDFDAAMLDVKAAMAFLREQTDAKIGIVGYCYGGSVAQLAAARVDGLSAAVGYYGRAGLQFSEEALKVPTMLHFGDKDESIPTEAVEQFTALHPEAAVYRYADAGHAFNRAGDPHFVPGAAGLALQRTLELFKNNLE